MRCSASRSSGVNSAPKSSASNTWRISTSAPPSMGQRLTHSIASALDFTWNIQKPAISSLGSAKGPSMTVAFPPENFTRAHAGLHQLLIVLPHVGEELLARHDAGFGVLVGSHLDHESHRH